MRDRIITIAALLFIAACALVTFIRISSHYSAPDYQAPADYTAGPLVPDTASAAASTAAAAPPPATPRPAHTVVVRVTVTPPPVTASAGGEDGQ